MTSALSALERTLSERIAVCGQRSSKVQNITQPRSRIVGGSPAPPGSWPWLVNLQLDGGLMCGGVLVDTVVSTTGQMTLMITQLVSTKLFSLITHQSDVLLFLQFNPKTFNNDIALVELTSPVVLSEHVTPVCLPSGMEPPTGSSCLVAGWGSLFEGDGDGGQGSPATSEHL
uniref:Peptidase S1 domain-containing protein n=1 Tax=Monopterus albus TaxID=43700 RepID=A0A3Q3JKN3_MONAL